MVGDHQLRRRARAASRPSLTSLREQLGVVDDLVVAAEVGVLVGERVEAVRAVGDDLRDAGLVERGDVLLGERLEHVLVAHPPRGVAGAALARAEDRELDAGRLQQLRGRLAPSCARARRTTTRSPPSTDTRAPDRPARARAPPSSAAQSARCACGWPHGFELRSMSRSIGSASAGKLDSTITRWRRRSTMWSMCSIDTGHACTQAPQVTQSQTDSSGTALGTSGVSAIPLRSSWSRRPMITSFGREQLAGLVGRADVLAAAALGAGERVEHLLPGQVGGGAGAEAQVLLALTLLRLEAQRLEPPARCGAPEPDVDRGGGDVQVLGAREVGEEREDRQPRGSRRTRARARASSGCRRTGATALARPATTTPATRCSRARSGSRATAAARSRSSRSARGSGRPRRGGCPRTASARTTLRTHSADATPISTSTQKMSTSSAYQPWWPSHGQRLRACRRSRSSRSGSSARAPGSPRRRTRASAPARSAAAACAARARS